MSGELEWRPYSAHVLRPKVRDIVTRGKVEYELCLEGGSYVIRRTDRRRPRVRVDEAARGSSRSAWTAWQRIIAGADS